MNIECFSPSFSTIFSIEARVPNGLPQRMHSNGCSSLISSGWRASSVKLRRGSSRITRSGQVLWHRPALHAGVLDEASCGRSGLSTQGAGRADADAGEAERAARDVHHDPAEGRALRQRHMVLTGVGRRRVQLLQREPHQRPLVAHRQEARPPASRAGAGQRRSSRASTASGSVVQHQLEPSGAVAEAGERGIGIGELRLEPGELVPPPGRHQHQESRSAP